MIASFVGRLLVAALIAPQAVAGTLTATLPDGTEVARIPVPEGSGWCVVWNHSVDLFQVEDCYENQAGRMVLVRSHLPDFAAGLDHIPGRGKQISDGQGGYWIIDLDEPVPGNSYILRPGGSAVDHRLRANDYEVSLSASAARARVTIKLSGDN